MDTLTQDIINGKSCKITFSEFINNIDKLPSRRDFLDADIHAHIEKQIAEQQPLLFMPNAVSSSSFGKFGLHVYGILPDGSKTCVRINNIPIHVDVTDINLTLDELKSTILIEARSHSGVDIPKPEIVEQFMLHGFQEKPRQWLRYNFDEFPKRVKFLRFLDELKSSGKYNLHTANDDSMAKGDQYYMVAAATYLFNTGDWNVITNYKIIPSTRCDHTFEVSIDNYNALNDELRKQIINDRSTSTGKLADVISKDPSMILQWDIETHKDIDDGRAPEPADDYTIFNMCTGFFWHHSAKPLYTTSIIIGDCNADDPDVSLIVVCDNERQLLIANYTLWSRMKPDAMDAFNGGHFDWVIYREKLRRENLIPEFLDSMLLVPDGRINKYLATKSEDDLAIITTNAFKWSWSDREKIKIDAENDHILKAVFNVPGIIDLDTLPLMLKSYPRAEVPKLASLNFFLDKNKLPSKEDMPYKLMFKIYERSRDLMANKPIVIRPILDCISMSNGSMADATYCEYIKPELLIDPSGPNKIQLPAGPRDIISIAKLEIKPSRELLNNLKSVEAFKEQSRRDMALVGKYCIIDCVRPQQLFVKRGIYSEYRELANLARVGIFEAFYRAGGMKVRNMIRIHSKKFNIGFSNGRSFKKPHDKNHYPGAWVFQPIRGLHTDRPITGEDVSSLYPSLKMTYNYSPDMVVKDPVYAEDLKSRGYNLKHVKFDYEQGEEKGDPQNKQLVCEGWVVRHNGAYGPDSHMRHTYKKTVTSTNDRRVVKYEMVPTTPALVGERMGIFPYIVKLLFDMRVPIKKEFVRLSEILEDMHTKGQDTCIIDDITYSIDDLEFKIMIIEAKQKAIKLLANTFYGESGNYLSSIYELVVAGGITTSGQATIKSADAFCTSLGYKTCYGDTDSLYLKCPVDIYADCDELYARECVIANAVIDPVSKYKELLKAKLRYWTSMVKLTMKKMSELSEQLSDHMLEFNQTNFINLAYEEVLFPTGLLGKKKYFGTPHLKEVNFGFTEESIDKLIDDLSLTDTFNEQSLIKIATEAKLELFIRGIETIKQGKADIVKNIGTDVMKRAVSIFNESSMMDIVKSMITNYYSCDVPASKYSLLGRYKPDKQNVPIHTFYKRMRQAIDDGLDPALYTPSEPGDKFRYVVCKKPLRWTLSGKKIEIKKGDQMEFMRVYDASQDPANGIEPMVIDRDYYMKKSIVGILARFISYYPEYQPTEVYDLETKKGYETFDKYCVKEASKYLESICDNITGVNKKENFRTGVDYRAIYKSARKHVMDIINENYGTVIAYVLTSFDANDNVSDTIKSHIVDVETNAKAVDFDNITVSMIMEYDSLYKRRIEDFKKYEKIYLDTVYEIYADMKPVLRRYYESLARFVESYRVSGRNADLKDIKFNLHLTDVDLLIVEEFYNSWNTMIDLYKNKARSKATQTKLVNARMKMINKSAGK